MILISCSGLWCHHGARHFSDSPSISMNACRQVDPPHMVIFKVEIFCCQWMLSCCWSGVDSKWRWRWRWKYIPSGGGSGFQVQVEVEVALLLLVWWRWKWIPSAGGEPASDCRRETSLKPESWGSDPLTVPTLEKPTDRSLGLFSVGSPRAPRVQPRHRSIMDG